MTEQRETYLIYVAHNSVVYAHAAPEFVGRHLPCACGCGQNADNPLNTEFDDDGEVWLTKCAMRVLAESRRFKQLPRAERRSLASVLIVAGAEKQAQVALDG
jgi:hypothetical protein